LEKLAQGMTEFKKKYDELLKKFETVKEESGSTDALVKLSEEARKMGEEYVKIGGEAGGFFLNIPGSLIGFGASLYQGNVLAAMKLADDGKKMLEKTGGGVKEVTEKSMEIGGHVFEKCVVEGNDAYKVTLKSGTELAIQAGTGAMSVVKKGMESGDEMRKELKDFSENMAKLGVEGFGNFMHTTVDAAEK